MIPGTLKFLAKEKQNLIVSSIKQEKTGKDERTLISISEKLEKIGTANFNDEAKVETVLTKFAGNQQ